MSNLKARVKKLFLTGDLDAICGASIVYLAMGSNNMRSYEDVKNLAEQVKNSVWATLDNNDRKMKVSEALEEMEVGYKSVVGLNTMKALKMDTKICQDDSRDEIEENFEVLMSKLNNPARVEDVSLYGSLRTTLNNIDTSEYTWRDPEASMVLTDESKIVQELGKDRSVYLWNLVKV